MERDMWFKRKMKHYVDEVDDRTREFFEQNEHIEPDLISIDDPELMNATDGSDVMDKTQMPWIPLSIPVPKDDILDEALNLLYTGCFSIHRPDGNGWMSICISGLGATMTGVPEDYGLEGDEADLSDWTDIAKYCPKTVQWMNDEMRYQKFSRVRFMALLPGGSIGPHIDRRSRVGIGATNVAINNPDGCSMVLEDVGTFPWKPGMVSKINTGYKHSVWNRNEEEPRIHMIFDGKTGDWFNEKVRTDYIDMMKNLRGE